MKEEIKQCRFIQRIDSIHLLTTKKVISYLCVVPLRRVPEEPLDEGVLHLLPG
jgi:hypothetical protein